MAQRLTEVTPDSKPPDVANPDGSFLDKNEPNVVGSPTLAGFANSTYSFFSAMMVFADISYSGLVDTTTVSQYFQALTSIINTKIREITDPLTNRVTTNENDISVNAGNISTNSSDIGILGSRITSNDSDISALQDKTPQQYRTTDSITLVDLALQGITSVKDSIISLLSRMTNTENATSTNTSNIATLDGRIDGNDSDITALDGRVSTNEGDISTNTGDITDLDGRVTANEGDISTLDGRVTANDSDIIVVNNRIDGNDSEISALQNKTPQSYKITDDVEFNRVNGIQVLSVGSPAGILVCFNFSPTFTESQVFTNLSLLVSTGSIAKCVGSDTQSDNYPYEIEKTNSTSIIVRFTNGTTKLVRSGNSTLLGTSFGLMAYNAAF